ncbi:MAG: peptidylprolyl isomerase [Haloarculaceae archaeon]
MAIERGDTVTVEYTGRLQDGTVFDTSIASVAEENDLDHHPDREHEPLTVEVGDGRIIEGLEEGLVGLDVGDEETITAPPGEAYGEHTEDRVVTYDPDELREMLGGDEPTEGMELRTDEGLPGTVTSVGDDEVRVDFNHELAGETLEFEIEVVSVE